MKNLIKFKNKKIKIAIALTFSSLAFFSLQANAGLLIKDATNNDLLINEILAPSSNGTYSPQIQEDSTKAMSIKGLYLNKEISTLKNNNNVNPEGFIPGFTPNGATPVFHRFGFDYFSDSYSNNSDGYYTTPTTGTVSVCPPTQATSQTDGTNKEAVFQSVQDAENTLSNFVNAHIAQAVTTNIPPRASGGGGVINQLANFHGGDTLAIYDFSVPVLIRNNLPNNNQMSNTDNHRYGYYQPRGGLYWIDPYYTNIYNKPQNTVNRTCNTSDFSYTPYVLQDTITVYPNGSYEQTGFNSVNLSQPTGSAHVLIATYHQGEYSYRLPSFLSASSSTYPDSGEISYTIYNVPLVNGVPEAPLISNGIGANYDGVNGVSIYQAKTLSSGLYNQGGLIGHYGDYDALQTATLSNKGAPENVLINCSSIANGTCASYSAGSYVSYGNTNITYSNSIAVDALVQQQISKTMDANNVQYGYINYENNVNSSTPYTYNQTYNNHFPDVNTNVSELTYSHTCGSATSTYSGQVSTLFNLTSSLNVYGVKTSNMNPQLLAQDVAYNPANNNYSYVSNFDAYFPKGYNVNGIFELGSANQLTSKNFNVITSNDTSYNPLTNTTSTWLGLTNGAPMTDQEEYGSVYSVNNSQYPLAVIPSNSVSMSGIFDPNNNYLQFNGNFSPSSTYTTKTQSCTVMTPDNTCVKNPDDSYVPSSNDPAPYTVCTNLPPPSTTKTTGVLSLNSSTQTTPSTSSTKICPNGNGREMAGGQTSCQAYLEN